MGFADSSVLSILFKIGADGSGAEAEVKRVGNSIVGELSRLDGVLPTGGFFGQMLGEATLFGGKLKNELDQVTDSGATMATVLASGTTLAVAGFAAVAAAAVATGAAIFSMAKEASDYGSRIHDASVATGFHADTLSALGYAARLTDQDFGVVQGSIIKFQRALAEALNGNKEAQASFRALGIDLAQAAENPEKAWELFIQRVNSIEGSEEKIAAVTAVAGRGAAALIPIFDEVGESLDDYKRRVDSLGQLMTDEGAAAADEFGDALTDLEAVVTGLKLTVGAEALPIITGFLKDVTEGVQGMREEVRGVGPDAETSLGQAEGAASSLGDELSTVEKVTLGLVAALYLLNVAIQFVLLVGGVFANSLFLIAQMVASAVGQVWNLAQAITNLVGALFTWDAGPFIQDLKEIGEWGRYAGEALRDFFNGTNGFDLNKQAGRVDSAVRALQDGPLNSGQNTPANPNEVGDAFSALERAREGRFRGAPGYRGGSGFRPTGGSGGGGKKAGKSEAEQNAEKDARAEIALEEAHLQAAQRTYREITEAAARSYRQRVISLDEYVRAEKAAEEDLYQSKLKRIAAERSQAEANTKLRPKELEAKRADLDEREAQAKAERNRAVQRLDDEFYQKQEQALRDQLRILEQMATEADRDSIASVKARIEQKGLTEEEGERLIIAIQLRALDRKRDALDTEWDLANEDVERKGVLNLEYQRLEQERAGFSDEAERRIAAAQKRDEQRTRDRLAALRRVRDELEADREENERTLLQRIQQYSTDELLFIAERARIETESETRRHERALDALAAEKQELLEKAANQEERLEIERVFHERREAERERHHLRMLEIDNQQTDDTDALNPNSERGLWGDELADKLATAEGSLQKFGTIAGSIFGEVSKNAGNMRSILGGAFSALAQGIAQTVTNFVLLGTTGPAAIRKMTAQILAGVAAQAAVKAVFELAEGLAALANPFTAWRAPYHFAAAKTYGLIAGVAAVAGRVVAGNAFQQDAQKDQGATGSSGSGGSGGRGSGGSGSTSAEEKDKTLVIEKERRTVEVIVRHERGTVVEIIKDDFDNNGPIRTMVEEGK